MKKLLPFFLLFAITSVNAQYIHDSLKVDQGYIHYYTKGKGKPVVLLQGGPGYSSYYMRGISDSLRNYRTILIDYQGTGRSQYRKADTTWVSYDRIIKDVEHVRKHLSIEKWAVIGNSYGSHYALYYAVRHPETISRVILSASPGTSNYFLVYYGDNISMRRNPEDIEAMNKLSDPSHEIQMKRMRIYFRPYFFDATKASLVFTPPEEESRIFFNRDFNQSIYAWEGFSNWDISEEVYALTIPIRIIQGRQDPVNGTEVQLCERARDSKLIYIERAGHFPWAEKPIEFFTALRKSMED